MTKQVTIKQARNAHRKSLATITTRFKTWARVNYKRQDCAGKLARIVKP